MDSPNSSTNPPVCVKGCGFFGSAENRNMCSKCYKDDLKEQIAKVRMVETATPRIETQKSLSSEKAISADSEEKTERRVERVKNRCESCQKKVGLTGFRCRCGMLLCGMHRYPAEHFCTFDFKKFDRQILVNQNPLVKADKLDDRI